MRTLVVRLLFVLVLLTPGAELSKYADLEQWAASHGAEIGKVGIAPSLDMGQVLAMREDVAAGDLVLSIPFEISMSSDWEEDSVLSHVAEAGADIPAFWRLALRLLFHRVTLGAPDGPLGASPFAAYVAALPRKHALPLRYADAQLQRLAGTGVLERVQAQRQQLERAFKEYLTPLGATHAEHFPAEKCTRELLEWAAAQVMSRAYRNVDAESGDEHYVFVPILDMANHRARPLPQEIRQRVVVRDVEAGIRAVYTPYALQAGEQYWHDYGPLTSRDVLVNYGFVPAEPNPDDTFDIFLDLQAAGASKQAWRQLVEGGVVSDPRVPRAGPFPLYLRGLSPGVVAAHRLALLEEAADAATWQRVLEGQPVSAANEARVRATLTATCESALAELQWSLEDDTRLKALEVKAKRNRSDTQELMSLRLVKSTRDLLLSNIQLFEQFEQEAVAALEHRAAGAADAMPNQAMHEEL